MFHRDFDISIAEYIEVYDKYLYKHCSFTNETSLFTLLMEVSYNQLSQISNTFADQISLAMYENYLIHFLWLRRVFFTEGYLSGGSWAKDVCAVSDFEPVFPKEIYEYFSGIGLLKIEGKFFVVWLQLVGVRALCRESPGEMQVPHLLDVYKLV